MERRKRRTTNKAHARALFFKMRKSAPKNNWTMSRSRVMTTKHFRITRIWCIITFEPFFTLIGCTNDDNCYPRQLSSLNKFFFSVRRNFLVRWKKSWQQCLWMCIILKLFFFSFILSPFTRSKFLWHERKTNFFYLPFLSSENEGKFHRIEKDSCRGTE